jgi:hypothetical protein
VARLQDYAPGLRASHGGCKPAPEPVQSCGCVAPGTGGQGTGTGLVHHLLAGDFKTYSTAWQRIWSNRHDSDALEDLQVITDRVRLQVHRGGSVCTNTKPQQQQQQTAPLAC